MDEKLVFVLKGILLTEALTHAVRSWGIFDTARETIARRSVFLGRLLTCFECTSVWISAGVIAYLYYLDFWPATFMIIISRLATLAHIFIDLVDALRASAITKI